MCETRSPSKIFSYAEGRACPLRLIDIPTPGVQEEVDIRTFLDVLQKIDNRRDVASSYGSPGTRYVANQL